VGVVSLFGVDRLRASIEAVVRTMMPRVDTLAYYTVALASWDDGAQLADVVPLRSDVGLPPALTRVPIRAGIPGASVKLESGATMLLGFADGDPGSPFLVNFDPIAAAGFKPREIRINTKEAGDKIRLGDAAGSVIREGDVVNIDPGNGAGVVAGTISITTPVGPTSTKVLA
jgi:hypothetical protein